MTVNSQLHGLHIQCPDCILYHGRFICEYLDRSIIPDAQLDELEALEEDHYHEEVAAWVARNPEA